MQPAANATDQSTARERAQSRADTDKSLKRPHDKKLEKAKSDATVSLAAAPLLRDQPNDLLPSRSYESKTHSSSQDRDGSSESSGGSSNSSVKVITIIPGLLQMARPARTPDNPNRAFTHQVKADLAALARPPLSSHLKEKVKQYIAGRKELFSHANVEKLDPKSRADLLNWSNYKLEQKPALKHVIETILAVQRENMDKQLIETICKDTELREALCLNLETLMDSKDFFSLVFKTFELGKLTKTQNAELMGFCVRWIAENRGTKFLEKAREELKKLEKHSPSITPLLAAKPIQEEEIKPTDDTTCKEMFVFSLVPKIKQASLLQAFEDPVEKTSKDILHFQLRLLRSLKPQHLAPKWGEKAKSLTSAYVAFQNNVTYYIIDTILKHASVEERASMLCFYLLLCEKLCALGDLSSAKAIILALSEKSISRLKASWNRLFEKFRGIEERYHTLETLFDSGQNEANLRAEIARRTALKEKILPFLGTIQKDLMFSADAGQSKVKGANNEPEYNIERIKAYKANLLDALAPLAYWQEEQNDAISNTNFVYVCYEASKTKSMDTREDENWNRSVALEVPKNHDATNVAAIAPGKVTLP